MIDSASRMTDNRYDDDLYIYYIGGKLDKSMENIGNGFLGNWEEDGFSFLFFTRPADSEVKILLDKMPELKLLDEFRMSYEQWQGGRMKRFQVGRLEIIPPWEKSEPGNGFLNVLLDPGVVFGNGLHPTTRDCLFFLDRLCEQEAIDTVLDLGTGTGVLALAAARLNCKKILAVDFNRLAVETTLRNIRINRMEDRILPVCGKAESFINLDADLVIANIHYDVMKTLIESDGFLTKTWFILSGLLRSQAKAVYDRLHQLPVTILDTRQQDGIWYTCYGKI